MSKGRYKGMTLGEVARDLVKDYTQSVETGDLKSAEISIQEDGIEVKALERFPEFVKFKFSQMGAGTAKDKSESEGAMTGKSELLRVDNVLEVMEAHGWDPDKELFEAKRSQSRFEHGRRKWKHDQTVKGVRKIPPVVLSNLIGLVDHGFQGWNLEQIRREIDGDHARMIEPMTQETLRIPSKLLIALVEHFWERAEASAKGLLNRNARLGRDTTFTGIKPKYLRGFTHQVLESMNALSHDMSTPKMITCFDDFVNTFGTIRDDARDQIHRSLGIPAHLMGLRAKQDNLEEKVMDALSKQVADEIDRSILDVAGAPPEYMRALGPVSYLAHLDKDTGYKTTVESVDGRNWKFQAGEFFWRPGNIQIEERHKACTKEIAISVSLRDDGVPNVTAMLEQAMLDKRQVCVELTRETGGAPGYWYLGAKARIEKLLSSGNGIHLTLVMDTAFISSSGTYSEFVPAKDQFRKHIGDASGSLTGPLPSF